MPLRRTLALAGAMLAMVLPLSSCGFDYATDRINSIQNGADNRDASVDVLGAVIVSAQDGQGTFIATFVNNDVSRSNTVDGLVGTDGQQQVTAQGFKPITVDKGSLVNLASGNQAPIKVTGQFVAGDYVPLSISFGNGEGVRIDVPVVTNCGVYEGLDGPSSGCTSDNGSSPSSSPSASPSPSA
jgi:hypothetical protein